MPWSGRAWCPGGRTTQNAVRARPVITASTALSTPPAARSATSSERGHTLVSPVESSRAPAATSRLTRSMYGRRWHKASSSSVAGRCSTRRTTLSSPALRIADATAL